MRYITSLVMTLIFAVAVNAGPDIERIKQLDPEAYNQAKSDCKSWAESDSIEANELAAYMEICISEAIGYLDDMTAQEYDYEDTQTETAE